MCEREEGQTLGGAPITAPLRTRGREGCGRAVGVDDAKGLRVFGGLSWRVGPPQPGSVAEVDLQAYCPLRRRVEQGYVIEEMYCSVHLPLTWEASISPFPVT